MNENVAAIFLLDKTIAFFVAKPFYCSFCQTHSSLCNNDFVNPVAGHCLDILTLEYTKPSSRRTNIVSNGQMVCSKKY